MNIQGKHVVLRAPEPSDLALLNSWANDPELWHWLAGWHFPYSMRSTAQWIEDQAGHDPKHQVWAIDADVGLVGTGTLDALDWKNRNAILSMMIGNPAARGKGYALDATQAILRLAFDELGMHRIEGHVLAYNGRSIAMYESKVGFIREGMRREVYFKGGKYHDAIVYGMTEPEYRRIQAANPYWDAPAAKTRPPQAASKSP